MSTYDNINEERVYLFKVPSPDLNEKDYLFYKNGELKSISKHENVPYKKCNYNYGKDFNIIDFESENYEFIVHKIRNGVNCGKICGNFFEDIEDLLDCRFFDKYGIELKFNSVNDMKKYSSLLGYEMENIKKIKHDKLINYLEYKEKNKKDLNYNEKCKELYFDVYLEKQENNEIKNDIKSKKNKFIIKNKDEKYWLFGSYFRILTNPNYKKCLSKNNKFLICDERLDFIVLYNQMNSFLKNDPNFLQTFFNKLGYNNSEINNFLDTFYELEELYNKIKNVRIQISQFDACYLLSDIFDGVHKDLYLKYNVLPFEGFDYSDWDYCLCEKLDKDYLDEKNELENYIKSKLNDIER